MPTKLDDSQINSQKLENLLTNVSHIKAPVEDMTKLPLTAEDGERIYVKSLKKDYVYNSAKDDWEPFGFDDEKIILFVIQRPSIGVQKAEIQFPNNGLVYEISSNTAVPGTTSTKIQVQKCSQLDYENVPVWQDVGTELEILANKKTSTQSLIVPVDVLSNDYFRIEIKELGTSLEGLTFNIKIKLI